MKLHIKAVDYYTRAVKTLRHRDAHPTVFDLAMNELASAHLALATILQVRYTYTMSNINTHSLIQDTKADACDDDTLRDIERRVTENLTDALHQYEALLKNMTDPGIKAQIESRIGSIHHRLGKQQLILLRANRVRAESRKHSVKLATQHLEKSLDIFRTFGLGGAMSYACALMDYLLLLIPLDGSATSSKAVETAVVILVKSAVPIRTLARDQTDERAVKQVAAALENHLIFVLREWSNFQAGTSKKRASACTQLSQEVTKLAKSRPENTPAAAVCETLASALDRIGKITTQ